MKYVSMQPKNRDPASGNQEVMNSKARALLGELVIEWPQCGMYIGPGWFSIVERALRAMVAAGWNKSLQQVKQKFCGLRIYVDETNEQIDKIIEDAESECWKICELCGKPRASENSIGWALCEECGVEG